MLMTEKRKQYVSDKAQLMAEWNWERNTDSDPSRLTLGSHKKVWWKCSKGHEWQTYIKARNIGIGCPYCSGRYAIKGVNDLQTINPILAKEWDFGKNSGLKSGDVLPNSRKKVWWKCSKGHEWQARIDSRNRGTGCPICNSERNTSFPEYALLFYFQKYGFEKIHSYKEKGYELDIYIPSLKIAIEYDGYYWHKGKVKDDLQKNHKCVIDGIKLYRIREGLPSLNDSSIDFFVQKNQEDLSSVIEMLLIDIIGTDVAIDLKKDAVDIENLRDHTEKNDSFSFYNPLIAKEWNYEKNGKLNPAYFTKNSHKRVWWICQKGHEWQATIDNRNKGYSCPFCSGRRAIKGVNDLETNNPYLAKDWDFEKNNGLMPGDVLPNSGKKVWWKCSKGHEWQAVISARSNGTGCPYCSGKRAIKGYNDLQTINPYLAKDWNYRRNGELTPDNVLPNSDKKVWWICQKGHEWQSTIYNRNKGNGCPYCSGRKVLKGFNDLKTVNPLLAKEWNCDKNGDSKPDAFTANSNSKVWWKCKKGHEWQARIAHRNNGSGCPICAKCKKRND